MSKTYAFGVDIGGTTIKMGLFETNGKLLEMWEIPTRTEADGKFILKPDIHNGDILIGQLHFIKNIEVFFWVIGIPHQLG